MEVKEKTRLHLLDALRGFVLIHMIAFHIVFKQNQVNKF